MSPLRLVLAHFYPRLMNLYGDGGNVLTLRQRCLWRGIELAVAEVNAGDRPALHRCDLAFLGGGQDKEQIRLSEDLLRTKGADLRSAVADGLVMLAVCGGFQLLGEYYQPPIGPLVKGLSILDLYTVGGPKRAIGDVLARTEFAAGPSGLLVGFENHSGRTYLRAGCRPLGKVLIGSGNNGLDGLEGARRLNCFGTYLHGPLLPKNPAFADYLLALALERRYGKADLEPLDDDLEEKTRRRVIGRIKKRRLFRGLMK